MSTVLPLGLRVALRHLTVWPVPWDAREEQASPGNSVVWFPLVGMAIGAVLAGILWLPLPRLACAALALAAWTVASGGLHEDALMDCADAAVPPIERARRLEILKDPHVGAHGITAAAVIFIARFAGLAELPWTAALVAPIAGRWCMAITLATGKPLQSGLGARFASGAPRVAPTLCALMLLAALSVIVPWRFVLAALPGVLAGMTVSHAIARRLGGFNGDVHGAGGIIAETSTLYFGLIAAAL